MRDGLRSRRYRALILELHPEQLRARGVDPAICLRGLADLGYRGWTIDVSPAAYRRALDPGDANRRPAAAARPLAGDGVAPSALALLEYGSRFSAAIDTSTFL
jgi:hypothetical protein